MMDSHSSKLCPVHAVAYMLVMVGALNWGLVGLGQLLGGKNLNVVNLLLGSWPMVESVVYLLVGLSAVAMCFTRKCSMCKE